MRAALFETVAAEYALPPDLVRVLLDAYSKDPAAASLADIKASLPPSVAHQLDYNLSIVARGQTIHDQIAGLIAPGEQPAILDIGAGLGGMLLPFGRRGFALHAIELDAGRQKLCEANLAHLGLKARFYRVDLCERTIPDLQVDCIICNSVIEHVSDPVTMIERMGALLKPGGVLYFGVANKDALGCVIADPHYGTFGLTLLPNGLARRYYGVVAKAPQAYSVEEFFPIASYINLLTAAVGPVTVLPDPEKRAFRAFPELLARVAAGFHAAIGTERLAADKLLRRQFEQHVTHYISRATAAYADAIEAGTQVQFTDRFIRKSHQMVAKKPTV